MVGTGPCTFTTSKLRSSLAIRGQWATKEENRHSPNMTRLICVDEITRTLCCLAVSPPASRATQVEIPEIMGGASDVTISTSSGRSADACWLPLSDWSRQARWVNEISLPRVAVVDVSGPKNCTKPPRLSTSHAEFRRQRKPRIDDHFLACVCLHSPPPLSNTFQKFLESARRVQ